MFSYVLKITFIVVCGVGALFIQTRPDNQALTLYMTDTETVNQSDIVLDSKASKAFLEKFEKYTYFAAFAVHPDGYFAIVKGRHSPEDARIEALSLCNKGQSSCVIYAERHPKNYDPSIAGNTISQRSIGKNMKKHLPIKGTVLYALGNDGSWAVESSLDGYYFPEYFLKRRCKGYQAKSSRPKYLPRTFCQVFKGPVYSVKKPNVAENK